MAFLMKKNSTGPFVVNKERMNTFTMKPDVWLLQAKPSWIDKKNLPLIVQN